MITKKTSYGLNEEEQVMFDLVREFAEKEVAPRAAEIDRTGQFPWDLKEQMANLDILAMPFPEESVCQNKVAQSTARQSWSALQTLGLTMA